MTHTIEVNAWGHTVSLIDKQYKTWLDFFVNREIHSHNQYLLLTTKACKWWDRKRHVYFSYVDIILKFYMTCMYIVQDKTEKEEERKNPFTQSNIIFFYMPYVNKLLDTKRLLLVCKWIVILISLYTRYEKFNTCL